MTLSQWAQKGRSDSLTETVLGLVIVGAVLMVAVQSKNVTSFGRASAAGSGGKVTAIRRAIIGQESAGNFKAVNPHSGALGYGQVMPENVPSWTKEALGRSLTTDEFLADPKIQIKVIDFKLNQYYQEGLKKSGGDEEVAVRWVASTWYSGQGKWWNDTTPQFYNGHPYPSINDYTASVFVKYQQEKK
ncbi:transglycosylase SLT domain-containing protein [Trichocoleus desertorum AS-A10]|uniref:transglycosylase SLT domain-containing protein n=1 Tax=Trichocoleus desertorum TaxID=1481672 RepID=UPI00329A5539